LKGNMTITATTDQGCPDCGTSMNLEARTTLDFVGGRGPTLVDRFHCNECRRFYNVPVAVEEKK